MRAFLLNGYGDASRTGLRDVPKPTPSASELLVRVEAAGLNPVDYKIRAGKLRVVQDYRMPVVMGCELAGVVEACGAATTRFAPGERVVVRVSKEKLGAFAEYARVAETLAARAPTSVDTVHAAGLPLAGLTALQALREQLRCGPGQRLLITGGAGGVGTLAIPIAKQLGGHVTTTASPRGEALVHALGADVVIDYTKERLSSHAREFDGALDLVGGATLGEMFGCVKRGGRVVSIAGMPEIRTAIVDMKKPWLAPLFLLVGAVPTIRGAVRGVDYRYLFMRPDGGQLGELVAMVDAGKLPITVDRVFEFERIREAFDYLEQGRAKGKVVVRMAAPS